MASSIRNFRQEGLSPQRRSRRQRASEGAHIPLGQYVARQPEDVDDRHVPCHPASARHRYLAAFEWRFNHRFDLAGAIDALAQTLLTAKPAPYQCITFAEASGNQVS